MRLGGREPAVGFIKPAKPPSGSRRLSPARLPATRVVVLAASLAEGHGAGAVRAGVFDCRLIDVALERN